MMRWMRCAAVAAVALAALGCEPFSVRVEIPDFESNEILGAHVWREKAGGGWRIEAEVVFSEPWREDGREWIELTADDGSGSLRTAVSRLVRVADGGDRVRLDVAIQRGEGPGRYRISTFNEVGRSPLSAEVAELM